MAHKGHCTRGNTKSCQSPAGVHHLNTTDFGQVQPKEPNRELNIQSEYEVLQDKQEQLQHFNIFAIYEWHNVKTIVFVTCIN